jgi:hypothetical protein
MPLQCLGAAVLALLSGIDYLAKSIPMLRMRDGVPARIREQAASDSPATTANRA